MSSNRSIPSPAEPSSHKQTKGQTLVNKKGAHYVLNSFKQNFGCLAPLQIYCLKRCSDQTFPQWGAADSEMKVSSGENTELKRSPFKAWSMSVYSHTCYAYCQGFLPDLFLSVRSIHLHFSEPLPIFPVLAVANTGSCVGPQNTIGHPAGCRFRVECPRNIDRLKKQNKT